MLSANVFNERSGTVIAMALTSQEQRAGFPLTHVEVREAKEARLGKISQVRTLSISRLGGKIGRVPPEDLDRLVDGLTEIIT